MWLNIGIENGPVDKCRCCEVDPRCARHCLQKGAPWLLLRTDCVSCVTKKNQLTSIATAQRTWRKRLVNSLRSMSWIEDVSSFFSPKSDWLICFWSSHFISLICNQTSRTFGFFSSFYVLFLAVHPYEGNVFWWLNLNVNDDEWVEFVFWILDLSGDHVVMVFDQKGKMVAV